MPRTLPMQTEAVGVFNQAINGLGAYTSIRGFAKVKDASEPAALSVVFDNPSKVL